jgi:dipeptidyl aminopeptidase/acylaminoacyl peptidase
MSDGFSRVTDPRLAVSEVKGLFSTRQRLRATSYLASILIILSSLACAVALSPAQQTKKAFTVAEEIGLAHFGDPYLGQAEALQFSPDGNYFAVVTERGRLELNRVEDSLRFYRSQDVEIFLEHSDQFRSPSPIWVVNLSTNKEGPIISRWRWLADSSGVAYLERLARGNKRLMLADLRKKVIEPLTSTTERIEAFDVRDRNHYVYTVSDPVLQKIIQTEKQSPAIVGTGRPLIRFLFPDNPLVSSPRSLLVAVVGSERFEVKNDNGEPLVLFGGDLVLSPGGHSLVTTLPIAEVPSSWETLYPPPYVSYPYRIRAGRLDPQSGKGSVNQYVRINLEAGSVQSLTDAPISSDLGWWTLGSPSWSSDGQAILLPGTFLRSKNQVSSRPCVAVVDLEFNKRTCVEMLKGHTDTDVEEGYHLIDAVRFAGGDKQRVLVSFHLRKDFYSLGTTEYRHTAEDTWQVAGQTLGVPPSGHNDFDVSVIQGVNDPPRLFATKKQTSKVIWDPNPQLENIEIGAASVYTWKDKEGRNWRGGLYRPSNYKLGQRYPLVIQTHGFAESQFRPSGVFPTAFAARALAAAGIAVLQTGGDCPWETPDEGSCAVAGYEAAANQLVSEGLVDPEKIGIIGFSRTCFYVMATLTTGSLHLRAASITDGVTEDYFQYMYLVDFGSGQHAIDANSVIGAKPFGDGLQQWLKRSPGFNLDKVTAPLLVVGEGPVSLLLMWGPYAGLRYLHKPVDLVMLNTDEHALTNPAVRMASQGGSVDWFRFWLQDYEDPDPAKAEQYKRWRELRKLQEANGRKPTTPEAVSQ